jgi:hypothetical protein
MGRSRCCRGRDCDAPCIDCHGAGIPNKKLRLSWTGVSPVGSGSVDMAADCFGTWDTGCHGYNGLTRWIMRCDPSGSGNQVQYEGHEYATACGGASFPHDYGGTLSVGSPYPFTWTLTFGVGTQAYIDGFRTITVSDPDSGSPRCCFLTFLVTDASATPLPGITVTVWTNSSKTTLLGSAVSDAGGLADVNLGTTGGASVYYEAGGGRYAVTSGTTGTVSCGQWNAGNPFAVALAVASGYVQTPACPQPIATTLHATHPRYGAITLAYNGSGAHGPGWYATVNYAYPGCYGCPAKTVTVTCFVDTGSLSYQEFWKSK